MKKRIAFTFIASAVSLIATSSLAHCQSTSTKPDVGILEHKVEKFALKNATIVLEPGRTIEKGTILVDNGKISDVGVDVAVPADAVVIDMTGKTIYSGFIDAGIEVEVPAAEAPRGTPHWNSEITPDVSIAKVAAGYEATMAKLRKAGITTALVAPRDGIIKGTSAVFITSDETPTDALISSDVALHVKLTVTRGGGGRRDNYPSSPMGAAAIARQTFLDAQWYSKAWQAYRSQAGLPKPETNSALETIHHHLDAGKLVMFDALNEQYALRADAFGKEFGINVVLKGSGQEYQLLEPIAKSRRPIIVPLNFPKPPNVATPDAALEVELEELTHWELAPENPARLDRAGVKIAFTSSGLTDPSELIAQIRKAIKRGLDPNSALAAITTTPASILNIEKQCGRVAPGTWANLVVSSGPLFDEKSKIEEVWVKGKRPATAYKNEVSVDGKWSVTTVSGSGEGQPNEFVLVLSDTVKKPQGSLALPKLETAAKAEETKVEESKTDAPKADAPKADAPKADAPKAEGQNPPPAAAEQSAAPEPAKPVTEPAKAPETATAEAAKPETQREGRGEGRGGAKKPEEKGKAKLNALKWADQTVVATFSAKSLIEGQTGVAYLSLANVPETGSDSVLIGTIQWPDGRQQMVRATRTVEAEKDKAADAKPDEKKDAEKVEKKEPEKKDDKVVASVHYPAGVLGRDGLPSQPDCVVVQNTTIWTSGPQGILTESDFIVQKGIITAVGKDLPVPAGAIVIDGSKMQVSPGLIDCHSHMASDSGINESAQAVTAEVRIGDFIDAGDITIYRQLAGGLTAANILHGSANPIGGQNQVIKLRWGGTYDDLKFKDAPAGIKFALGENVKQSNVAEGARTRYPQSRMGVEQLIRDRFNAALEYDAAWKQWNKNPQGLPPRKDLELEAIAEILRGERWIHCHSYRQDEILGLLRVAEEYHVKIGSLQHILEGYKVADAIAKHGATASTFSDWWAYKMEVTDAIPYNGAIMHNQGIIVSFNSDDAELGRHMNHEAAKAVKYGGIDPAEALKFVTLNPAKQLRIDAYVGSIEVGKHADFAIWNGSPLSPMSRCEQTWIDGRKYFDREDDAAMRKRDDAVRFALIQKILDSGEASGERSSLADDPSRLWPYYDEFCHHHDHDHDGADAADHAAEHMHHEHE